MSAPDADRLARLEERLAWFERHVTEQDKAMLELSALVDRLKLELRALRDRSATGAPAAPEAPHDERPPHY